MRNSEAFGRPKAGRGRTAYPQLRFVSLLEGGTHVLFGTQLGPYATSEMALAKEVISHLKAGMLCLADRYFFGFALWEQARATGAELLWRVQTADFAIVARRATSAENLVLPPHKRLEDGSFSCFAALCRVVSEQGPSFAER